MRITKGWITKKKVILSLLLSLFVLLANYIAGNTSFPLPEEMKILKRWDKFLQWNGWIQDSIPNEVLLVNVTYDKQLVDYKVFDMPVGKYAITDRQKLHDFLTIAKHANNYKYIMLDIIFEKGISSPQDSALFHLIASMDRITIPVHEDIPLQDSILYKKAANSDYTTFWDETEFSRFQYIHDDIHSIPLRMYEDICGKTITQWGLFYFSNGWFCRNGITLQMPIRFSNDIVSDGDKLICNTLNLGADLLDNDSISSIANEINNRIVVIGDFINDQHDTYIGRQPGSIICLNAYYALQRGDHSLFGPHGGVCVFFIIIGCLYFIMGLCYLNNFKPSTYIDKKWVRLVLSPVSLGVIFGTIALIAYRPFGIIYNVWIPIGIFSVIDFITNTYTTFRKHYEKKESISINTINGSCSEGGTVQDPKNESSPNND